MKIILVAVMSANGKLTRGKDPDIYSWTSEEDQTFFFTLVDKAKLMVCGRKTYEIIRNHIKHKKSRLRIVMTKNPGEFLEEENKGLLEFTEETPRQLVERLAPKYNEMLLVGGAGTYSSFARENLIDEVYLTIEPVIFASGKNLFEEGDFEANLSLVSSKKLNKKGTLLLKYKYLK